MKRDHSPAVFQVVRYGLPLVILIFYITASWRFSYTPDSTFLSLRLSQSIILEGDPVPTAMHPGGSPNPLWAFFLAIGGAMKLDAVLTAKIFSLFFSCLSVLLTYLLASEILRDRFLAFCSSLALATSGWLLQAAPAGSALAPALTLMLAALFFMLRNDYLLSAFMLGLGTLLFWQAAGAFLILLWDAWWNSTDPGHRVRLILTSALLYVCVLLPWLLFAGIRSLPPVPWLVPLDDFPGLTWSTGITAAFPAIVAAIVSFGKLRYGHYGELPRKSHIIVMSWAGWFLLCFPLWGWEFWLFALPVIIVYAFSGVQHFARLSHFGTTYVHAFLLTGVLILLHQGAFTYATKPVMVRTERDSEELAELAYWVKNGVPGYASVSAERPQLLAYYAGRPVSLWNAADRPNTEYVVSAEEDIWGYDVVHRASSFEQDELLAGGGRFAVWRKR